MNNNIIVKKSTFPLQMKIYTKTSENQNFNDFSLETLAWINLRRRTFLNNNNTIVSFSKKCSFRGNFCTVKFFLNMQKKKSRGLKKESEVWNGRSLIMPLRRTVVQFQQAIKDDEDQSEESRKYKKCAIEHAIVMIMFIIHQNSYLWIWYNLQADL